MFRTIKNTLQIIRQQDIESDITEHCLRTLAKSGKIKTINVGSKCLIHIPSLFNYLNIENKGE